MSFLKKIINGILKRFNLRIISYSRYCILVERGEVLSRLDNISLSMHQIKGTTDYIKDNSEYIKDNSEYIKETTEYTKDRSDDIISKNDRILEITRSDLNKSDDMLKKLMYTRWNLIDTIRNIEHEEKLDICPICGTKIKGDEKVYETECIFNGGRLKRIQCSNCDLIFGDNKIYFMTDKELSDEYRWHYSIFNEGDSHTKEVKAFLDLNPKKDGIYLNYGAGSWSKSTKTLRDMGYEVYAYEPYAPEDNPYYITEKDKLKDMKFDGIFSQDLLEHLKYPIDELKFMSSILKDDGVMNHVTGCYEYMYEYTRFHLFFFLGKSKYIMAEKAGLSLESYNIDNNLIYYSCIYKKKGE